MQPCSSREMQSLLNQSQQISLLQDQDTNFDPSSSTHHDDFLEQMLNTIHPSSSSWPHEMINTQSADLSTDTGPSSSHFNYGDDQSAFLASKLRQHQISGDGGAVAAAAKLLLQQQMMMALTGETDAVNGSFKSPNQALYNGFAGSLHGAGHALNQLPQHFHHSQGGAMQAQSFSSPAGSTMNNQSQASGSTGGAPQQPRQRVRARRGQATDPHSIAERLRRERIAERMKALQELVPNANKTDKASMLDEIIDYVKFLQLQVKVLSVSRLGGAGAVAPLVADMSTEGDADNGAVRSTNGNQVTASSSSNNDTTNNNNNNSSLTMTEHQVAKLMEQDMGQAMQYLQGKGLCLMPISLATAISTATCRTTPSILNQAPPSPSISALSVQSATLANGGAPNHDGSLKDVASVSKP